MVYQVVFRPEGGSILISEVDDVGNIYETSLFLQDCVETCSI